MNIDGMTMPIHITAGALALLAGFIALYAAKGAGLHRRSGTVFVYAMLVMGLTGALISVWHDIEANAIGGVLSAYLVITAATTMRQRDERSRRIDFGAMLLGFSIAVVSLAVAIHTISAGKFSRDGVPVPMYVLFGTIALLASLSDIRMLRPARVQGTRRLRRHLWRMCFALFIASGSYFLGQADTIPKPLRIYPLLTIAALLPLIMMFIWLWRVRGSRTPRATLSIKTVPERI